MEKHGRNVGETRGNACSGGTHAACGRMARLGHFRSTGANRAGQCARKRSENTAAKCRRTDWQSVLLPNADVALWPVLGGTVVPTPAGRGQSTMAPDRDRGPGRSARPVVLVSALGGLSPRAVFVSIVNERAIDRGPFQTGPGARHLVFRAAAAGASPVRTQTAFPIASRVPIPPVIPLLSITIYSEMPCGVGNILPAARERSRGGPRLPKRVRNARTKNAACQNGSWLPFAAGLQFPASVKAAAKETGNTPGLRLPRGSLRLSLHLRRRTGNAPGAVGTSAVAPRQAGFEPGSMKKEADRRRKFRTKHFMKTRLHFLETTCILSRVEYSWEHAKELSCACQDYRERT